MKRRKDLSLPCTTLIYDDHVKIGDVVTFFWCRKKHEGIIRHIGDTYEDCVEKSLKFNSEEKKKEKKKETVSQALNEPRQSKIKCREKFLEINKRKSSKSTQEFKSKKMKDMKESARTAANDAVEKELLNIYMIKKKKKKKNLISTDLSKKEDISNIFDNENDPTKVDQGERTIQLNSSPSDIKTSESSNTEDDSNKENNDNAVTDESSSNEYNKKEN
ncbi:uncharacterized protein [Anoplolepis gracilipes]|uniref:uncharacterized protein n=1 Tax=Anoplolepis gracilipes TaxID=354296 RepID=UPI003B9DD797